MKSYLTVPTMCGSSVADGSGRAGEGGLFGLFRKARTMTGKGRVRAGEGPVERVWESLMEPPLGGAQCEDTCLRCTKAKLSTIRDCIADMIAGPACEVRSVCSNHKEPRWRCRLSNV
jgi:hypothetical protein